MVLTFEAVGETRTQVLSLLLSTLLYLKIFGVRFEKVITVEGGQRLAGSRTHQYHLQTGSYILFIIINLPWC